MRSKLQEITREQFYFNQFLSCDEMMFDYKNLPESIDPKFLEDYLLIGGAAAICRSGSDYLVAPFPVRIPPLDQYGDGTIAKGTTANGLNVEGKIGVDAVMIYNDTARSPASDLLIDADAFAQIDTSSGINVEQARIGHIFTAPNDTIRAAIENILQRVKDGDTVTVASQNVYSELSIPDGGVKLLEITKPEKIQYIQYLSAFYDTMLRRHFARRGLSLRTGTKAAQQSREEINGMDSISWYYPINKLMARRNAFNIFNRIFGENVEVTFSEIWQQEYEAYKLRTLQADIAAEKETEGADGNDVSVDGAGSAGENESPVTDFDE